MNYAPHRYYGGGFEHFAANLRGQLDVLKGLEFYSFLYQDIKERKANFLKLFLDKKFGKNQEAFKAIVVIIISLKNNYHH